MKTKERKIGNKITKTAGAASLRRNLVIGLVALFIGCFALPANAQCEAKKDGDISCDVLHCNQVF